MMQASVLLSHCKNHGNLDYCITCLLYLREFEHYERIQNFKLELSRGCRKASSSHALLDSKFQLGSPPADNLIRLDPVVTTTGIASYPPKFNKWIFFSFLFFSKKMQRFENSHTHTLLLPVTAMSGANNLTSLVNPETTIKSFTLLPNMLKPYR